MDGGLLEREVIERRQVPEHKAADEEREGDAWPSEEVGDARRGAPNTWLLERPTQGCEPYATRDAAPVGQSGRPRSSSGGAIMVSRTCWTM